MSRKFKIKKSQFKKKNCIQEKFKFQNSFKLQGQDVLISNSWRAWLHLHNVVAFSYPLHVPLPLAWICFRLRKSNKKVEIIKRRFICERNVCLLKKLKLDQKYLSGREFKQEANVQGPCHQGDVGASSRKGKSVEILHKKSEVEINLQDLNRKVDRLLSLLEKSQSYQSYVWLIFWLARHFPHQFQTFSPQEGFLYGILREMGIG